MLRLALVLTAVALTGAATAAQATPTVPTSDPTVRCYTDQPRVCEGIACTGRTVDCTTELAETLLAPIDPLPSPATATATLLQ